MDATRKCAVLLVLIAGSACASHKAPATTTTSSSTERWSGSFKQVARSAVIGSDMTRARASGYGTITLTPVADQKGRVKVDLSVNTSLAGTQIAWAVFEGACNAPTPPVIQVNEFPTIEIGNSGSGIVRTELPLTLSSRATYHANVYWTGRATDMSNVMLCAVLDFTGKR